MMKMMARMIQEQSVANPLESEVTLTIKFVIQNIGQFNSEEITRFLEVYEYEMTKKGATRLYNRMVTLDVRVKVAEISRKIAHILECWNGFHQPLYQNY